MTPISDESFNILIQELEHFFKLNKELQEPLRSMLYETAYKEGTNMLNPGAPQDHVWFILEGIIKEISVDKETFDGKTVWFWVPGSFVYSIPGFFDQEPSECVIKVVKSCKVIFMSYTNWKILKETFTEIDAITEKIRGIYEKMRRMHADDITKLSTKEMYLKHKRAIFKILPFTQLKYVAEYLGMSPDTLGRHRRDY